MNRAKVYNVYLAILMLTIYKKKVANALVIGRSKWPENFSSWPEQIQTLFFLKVCT